jgi:glycosyltransferase involved in cell wall biosynthesis
MKLSIVVITFNEVKTVKEAIDNVRSLDIEKEIIVIDNCSTDGTAEIIEQLGYGDIKFVLQKKNYGVGRSYELGFEMSRGEYVFIQHSDLEYDYTAALIMLELAERTNLDAVFGSRFQELLKTTTRWSLFKERPAILASYISTYLVNTWYGYKFTDVIGAELYKTSVIQKIPISTYNTGFKFEHVSRMCKKRLEIGEINIEYKPRDNAADKKIKSYHIINALWAMVRVRFFE